jgi:ubiquinone/menaquinone biosynthesis C-methylase UbiE
VNERVYSGKVEKLRSVERLAMIQPGRAVDLALDGIEARSALDVGTGSGVFAEALVKRGLEVTGIDSSREMIEAAGDLVKDATFVVAKAEAVPLPDGFVDLAFLGMVLHEADDHAGMLREARRLATWRVAVLEWPYVEQGPGPPRDHRLAPDRVEGFAARAGLLIDEMRALDPLVMYLLRRDR